jgi:hypothetical protein
MEESRKTLKERKEYLQQLVKEKNQALQKAPEGWLRTCKHREGWQYYYRNNPKDSNGCYIKEQDMKFAKCLAQRDYDRKLVNTAEQEIKAIDKYFQVMPKTIAEDIYPTLHPARQSIITPIRETDVAYIRKWESVEYKVKEFSEDAPELYTLRGERVRSKSEMLIADMVVIPVLFNQHAEVINADHLSKIASNYYIPAVFTKTELKDYLQYTYIDAQGKLVSIFAPFPNPVWEEAGKSYYVEPEKK